MLELRSRASTRVPIHTYVHNDGKALWHLSRWSAARISLLRVYAMHAPWETGKARVAALLRRQLQSLPTGTRLDLAAVDGRRFRVDPTEPQFWMGLIDRGAFEPRLTAMMRSLVKHGHTVIDAGANFGWFTTLFSAAAGPLGAVHAFEPMPQTAAVLRENCALNSCENVTVVEMALGASSGIAELVLERGRACGDASLFGARELGGRVHRCRVTTLDEYVRSTRINRVDVIKCDVEGAELLFLQGAARTIEEYRPVVAIELNPATLARAGCKPRDVLQELARRANYTFHIVDESEAPRRIDVASCDGIGEYVNVVARVL